MFKRTTCRWRWLLGVVLAWGVFTASASAGELYVVTRANLFTPHVGCLLRFDDGSMQWLHFRPVPFKKSVLGRRVPGMIDANGYEKNINHLVGFRVPDEKLHAAAAAVHAEFARDPRYQLFHRDCVTFAIVACRACGLKTKDDHLAPITFFKYVKQNNDFIECVWDIDRNTAGLYTLPWHRE